MPVDAKLAVDKDTLIPLGLLIAVVMSAVAGTWAMASSFSDLKEMIARRDSELALRFQKLENQIGLIDAFLTDRWTRSNMEAYVEIMRTANPAIKIPDVSRIK